MKNRKLYFYLFVLLLWPQSFLAGQTSELLISEYCEWNHNTTNPQLFNHYVEIYNGTGSTVDMSNYQLWRARDAAGWNYDPTTGVTVGPLNLIGTLADGETFVIGRPESDGTSISDFTSQTWSFLNISGDDAIGLAKNNGSGTFVLIDIIGDPNNDPGSAWTVSGVIDATMNHTLVRNSNVCSPTTDWTSSSNTQWTVLAENDISNIGVHTCICDGTSSDPQSKSALFIGNSFTYYEEMPTMVKDIAANMGDNLTIGQSTVGGYTLEQHYVLDGTLNLIKQGGWDYVILQEQSNRPTLAIDYVEQHTFFYAKLLADMSRAYSSSGDIMFYSTWGYRDGDDGNCATIPEVCTYEGMQALLDVRYQMLADRNSALIAPVGKVWNYLRANYPNMATDLYVTYDNKHPSAIGSYAAAVTFYCSIFKNDPTQISYNYTLSATTAEIVRNAVNYVLNGVVSEDPEITYFEIPGLIQAEDYSAMSGIATESTNDTDGGQNVGWIDAGDWLEYPVSLNSEGTFNLNIRVASPDGACQCAVLIDGVQTGVIEISSTSGWQTWATETYAVDIESGNHTLQLKALTAGYNINWIEFVETENQDPEPETENLALNKPVYASSLENAGTIGENVTDGVMNTRWSSEFSDPQWIYVDLLDTYEIDEIKIYWETAMASNYDLQISSDATNWTTIVGVNDNSISENIHSNLEVSGQYIRIYGTSRTTAWGYSIYEIEVYGSDAPTISTQKIEAENYLAMSGIATEATADDGGGENVGWIDAGDWMDYSINIPETGVYTLEYRIASPLGGGQLLFQVDDNTLSSEAINTTGGWQTWQTISSKINLNSGNQTIRLFAQSGGFNINWFQISQGLKSAESLDGSSIGTIEIYPNPATQIININGLNDQKSNVEIYNSSGKLLLTEALCRGESNMDISNLNCGLYVVKVSTKSQHQIIKVTKR